MNPELAMAEVASCRALTKSSFNFVVHLVVQIKE
jgi:hypothetical protein